MFPTFFISKIGLQIRFRVLIRREKTFYIMSDMLFCSTQFSKLNEILYQNMEQILKGFQNLFLQAVKQFWTGLMVWVWIWFQWVRLRLHSIGWNSFPFVKISTSHNISLPTFKLIINYHKGKTDSNYYENYSNYFLHLLHSSNSWIRSLYLSVLHPYIWNSGLEFSTYTCMIIIYAWNKQYSVHSTMGTSVGQYILAMFIFLRSTQSSGIF